MRVECCLIIFCVFFFKQKTAYDMRISDWSSDVCSSDLDPGRSRVHMRFLTPKAAGDYDEKGRGILDKNWDIAAAAILNEDVPIGDSIQRSANKIGRASCRERVRQNG